MDADAEKYLSDLEEIHSSERLDQAIGLMMDNLPPDVFEQVCGLIGYNVKGQHQRLVNSIGKNAPGPPPQNGIQRAADHFPLDQTTRKSTMSTREAVAEMQRIRAAELEVKPHVGDIPAMDSAAGVYREALRRLGQPKEAVAAVSDDGIASRTLFRAVVNAGRKTSVAMDAATSDAYAKRFPNANRLKVS